MLLAACMGAAQSFGQGTDLGTIRGVVTDTAGAVIPNASVTIIDTVTNTARETKTNGQGYYEMFGLKSGKYKVSITAAGMSTTEIKDLLLTGSNAVSADAVLKVSASKETVVVSSEAASINTEDQSISETISSVAVTELPRDSRDVYSFLYLNPNITQGSADGEFKFLGAQSYGASFSLDGQRSNGGIFGEPTQSKPSLEAVGEVNILTSDFSAEYAGIANIRVNTKRGGADYHGSAFYNNKNSALAAWTLDDLNGKAIFSPTSFQSKYPNPYFNENDLGGSFGGPIPKLKRTWFFTSYERDYNVAPVKFQSNTVPHPSLYTGDFSGLTDGPPNTDPTNSSCVVGGVVSPKPVVPSSVASGLTAQEIAANTELVTDCAGNTTQRFITIPSRLLNPTTQALINTYFPKIGISAPINPANGRIIGGYQTILPGRSTLDSGVLRVDHDFSDKDHLYGVYNVSAQTSASRAVVNPYTGLGLTQVDRKNNTLSLSYTHAFSTNVMNEVRGGFNRENLLQHSNTTLEGFLSSIGFTQSDIDAYGAVTGDFALTTFGHPAINFGGTFATFTNGGRNTFRPLDQNLITYGDTLTWIKGKHAFRMGGDMVYNEAQDGFALNRGNVRGSITYSGTGLTPFTSFLLGLPGRSVSTVSKPRPAMDVHNWESGFFFQDTWKVNSRVTVNLGLRYELITPFIDKNDLIANFDPNFTDTTTGQLGRFVIPSNKTLQFLDPRIINFGYVLADDSGLGVGRGVVRTDKADWSPRVGLAWRLGNKSVIRGGYGIYYPTSAAQGIRDPIATNPFNQGVTKRSASGNPLLGWPGNGVDGISPISGGAPAATGNTPAVNVVPFNIHQPRIHQYNVTYEREIGWDSVVRVSYLGSTMHGLIAGKDLNQLQPSDTPFGVTLVDDNGDLQPGQICDPTQGNCGISDADAAKYRFPALGDFVLSYGNYGHAQSNAFQAQLQRRYTKGLLLNVAYTYLDQKSTALDTGNSSLGGIAYNSLLPDNDYGIDGYISKHRLVAYGVYDLPFGKRRQYGSSMRAWEDAILGGWSTTFNMFAKSGTGFTPFWICDDCNPVEPGNIGISSVDAVGDFNAEPSYRPTILSNNFNQKTGDSIWNAAAFGLPSVGADVFSNPASAKRNLLWGPSTWGVNLGLHKDFRFGERVTAQLGADVDNLFNHPLFSPNSDAGGGGGTFALLGDFNIRVDQTTGKLLPIGQGHPEDIIPNPDFGRLINSFSQEGVDSRRTVRLRLRITF
ncbi:MAG: carboxypeptidase regulatory-like domain-containing protein [Acidobacteria bacterium]|nr:carboxypeptidase regulatory-like domain-containing protein [Acidobacteriota bacterium]MBS1867421.1 carboxypeptidase regulatory-like domain-containing protein [Acidobacteriota bacterium]